MLYMMAVGPRGALESGGDFVETLTAVVVSNLC